MAEKEREGQARMENIHRAGFDPEVKVVPHPFRGRGRCWFPPQGWILAPPGSGGGGGGDGCSAEPNA